MRQALSDMDAQERPSLRSDSTMDQLSCIVKRSYLAITKGSMKDGMLSCKRWAIMIQNLSTGHGCIHFYKDERSANRGEAPRNSLSIESVVETHRVTDKKQMFDVLCPGCSHRFQAGSEAEADDWIKEIKKLIVYRKDAPPISPGRSLSLPVMGSVQYPHPGLPTPPEFSPPSISIPTVSPSQSSTGHSSPAEGLQNTVLSSNSSSDSSSLMSLSNSLEMRLQQGYDETRAGRHRVYVKENSKFDWSGECDLAVESESIHLYRVKQNTPIVTWYIGSLRRYGINKVCFTIDVGRCSTTGEGSFYFYTPFSSVIYSEVHKVAQRIEAKSESKFSSSGREGDEVSSFTSVSSYGRPDHRSSQNGFPRSSRPIYGVLDRSRSLGTYNEGQPCTNEESTSEVAYDHLTHNTGLLRYGSQQVNPSRSLPIPPRCSHPPSRQSSSPEKAPFIHQHSYDGPDKADTPPAPPIPPKTWKSVSDDQDDPIYINSHPVPLPRKNHSQNSLAKVNTLT